jgi:uncharacterized membrane protein YadS
VPGFILAFHRVCRDLSVPDSEQAIVGAARMCKGLLVIALFFIGTEIRAETLKRMRGRVLAHAVLLWLVAASVSLAAVVYGR